MGLPGSQVLPQPHGREASGSSPSSHGLQAFRAPRAPSFPHPSISILSATWGDRKRSGLRSNALDLCLYAHSDLRSLSVTVTQGLSFYPAWTPG